jgi:hydroxymethylbilane synthase
MSTTLTIGSRGSQLALWQARWVQARLAESGVQTRIEIIKTTGDKITDVPLAKVGSKGLFTKEIEEALLDGRVDLAVHSLKDLPTVLPEGLAIAAIPEREQPFDAVIGKPVAELPEGAKVGTSSLRRSAQLKLMRPDLRIEPVRGNLDTRLRKLDEGQYDAILLAAAGLRRLGWEARIAETLSPEVMCPAVGQGALAIETRESGEAREICSKLDHAATRAAVTAERAVLASLGGGCQVPIGAFASVSGEKLKLRAVVIHPDGGDLLVETAEGLIQDAEALGGGAARALLEKGARAILSSVYADGMPLAGRRVVVTRAAGQAGTLAEMLRTRGAEVVELPVIELVAEEFPSTDPSEFDWIVFTSANAVRFYCDREAIGADGKAKVVAIGPATGESLKERGVRVDVVAEENTGEGVASALAQEDLDGKKVLFPRAAAARDVIPDALTRAGATVEVVTVYRNVVPEGLAEAAPAAFAAKPDWVTFTSSSTVKNLLAVVDRAALEGVRCASIGPITSEVLRKHGLEVAAEANPATVEALVSAVVEAERR